MPKRRVAADSDDEHDFDASENSKRARTDDVSDEEQETRRGGRVKRGKGKARAEAEEDQAEDAQMGDDNEEVDPEAFEQQYGEAVFQNLQAKRNKAGYGVSHLFVYFYVFSRFSCEE